MNFDLRAARLNQGLTLRASAEVVGVDMHALWRAERGTAVPNPPTAKKIADFYGVQVTDIWPVTSRKERAA